MDIILIGSGNAATVLGRKTLAAGHRILQVYSRQEDRAKLLAGRLGARSSHSISTIIRKADFYLFALRDDAIAATALELGEIEGIAVHMSGAQSIEVLKPTGSSYGVIYPLQSLRKEIEILPPLTVLVDGHIPAITHQIKLFAATIAETVLEADDETRLKYHLAAIIVNNFTNYLFAATESFCKKENISFAVLQPLLEETVLRLRAVSPAEVQTGPALRKDQTTLEKHRAVLKEYPGMLNFYNLFTEEIQKSDLAVRH